ncbi:MAG TPA: hypothetical protein V6C63_21420 [Allocoleopsis sp.]
MPKPSREELICCFISEDGAKPCKQMANWMIRHSEYFDDFTHACSTHLFELGDPSCDRIMPIDIDVDVLSVRLPNEDEHP